MQEKIVEIIVYLLEEFRTEELAADNYIALSKNLMSRGYTENEINLAIFWVFDHFLKDPEGVYDIHYSSDSIRILNDVERMIISSEAYGYLLQLRKVSLITETEFEQIIERSLSLGKSPVTADDIKNIAASILFGSDTSTSLSRNLYNPGSNTIH